MTGLAAYAATPEQSLGRIHSEPGPDLRNEYQRDRDRVIHSSAFRRLEYKTQVFVNHEGDMFRTRLTHSIEVAQIGRTIARELQLNEDLTEAICLAHDLGHTPFGHAGQDALNQCMREYGGFEHNLQSLRVVDVLEEKYAEFPGLNLTYESREGILKHCSRNNARDLGPLGERFLHGTQPSLEAQIANLADEIAYNNHDVDDGLRAGMLSLDRLKECEIIRDHQNDVESKWGRLPARRLRHEIIRGMINELVQNVVEQSRANLAVDTPADINEVRQKTRPYISFDEAVGARHSQLKKFLYANLYKHQRVQEMTDRASNIIISLFETYMNDTKLLSDEFQEKLDTTDNNIARVIADYIAGMTDRFAIAEHEKISG